MSRQTAFPGVFVDSIKVETPPFDEPGIIQEFVGRGITRNFELLQRAADFSEENVHDVIESAEDTIGPLRDRFRLQYNLIIRAVKLPGDLAQINERGISIRARGFVRAKNPFEPDVLEVSTPEINEQLSSEKLGEVYNVSVTITK